MAARTSTGLSLSCVHPENYCSCAARSYCKLTIHLDEDLRLDAPRGLVLALGATTRTNAVDLVEEYGRRRVETSLKSGGNYGMLRMDGTYTKPARFAIYRRLLWKVKRMTCHFEKKTDELLGVTAPFRSQRRRADVEERRLALRRDGLREHGLSCARRADQANSAPWTTNTLEESRHESRLNSIN